MCVEKPSAKFTFEISGRFCGWKEGASRVSVRLSDPNRNVHPVELFVSGTDCLSVVPESNLLKLHPLRSISEPLSAQLRQKRFQKKLVIVSQEAPLPDESQA